MKLSSWIILVLISIIVPHVISTGGYQILQEYLTWNEVPTEIYLGLLSQGVSEVETVKLINGTCFQYEPHEFERCKYYSDCCAMTPARPMEQLAPGTFSCHNGFYVIDRCPANTQDQKLKELCETEAESGEINLFYFTPV